MDAVAESPTADSRAGTARTSGELDDVCIVTLGPALRVVEVNGDFVERLGWTKAQVCGVRFAELVHPQFRPDFVRLLAELSQGDCERFSWRCGGLGRDGSAFPADATGVAVRDHDGRVSTIVLLIRPVPGACASGGVDRRKLLSELDARVLEGVAAGISTVQLASKLYLSRQGIEYHVGAMLRRFNSPNRSALVAKAYSQGILTTGEWPPRVVPEFIR